MEYKEGNKIPIQLDEKSYALGTLTKCSEPIGFAFCESGCALIGYGPKRVEVNLQGKTQEIETSRILTPIEARRLENLTETI